MKLGPISARSAWLPLCLTLASRVAWAQPAAAPQPPREQAPSDAAEAPASNPGPQAPPPEPAPPETRAPAPPDTAAPPTPRATPAPPAAPPPPSSQPLPPVAAASPAATSQPPAPSAPAARIVYRLERIELHGNRTRDSVIRGLIPLEPGDALDVDDPVTEALRLRLLATGWFDEVRLRLERGSQRGWVVLVVEVQERNTLVISRVVAGLARVVTSSKNRDDKLRPYGGLGLTETNLFGLGLTVSGAGVISEDQAGLDLRYHDPLAFGSGFDLGGRFFYNHAREFFGRDPVVAIRCPEPPADDPEASSCDPDVQRERAVVIYDRAGIGLSTGHDIAANLRYEVGWLGEVVDVDNKPRAASTRVGEDGDARAPIDFRIDDGISHVSSLQLALVLDARDHPALPRSGQLLRLDARVASGLIGSTYDFGRYEATFRHFQPLPWQHVLSLGAYAGLVVGRAPFFSHFYAADLSDLLPSRVLELNLDHRHTHNLLDTSIVEYDKAEVALRIDFEYQLPLFRGAGDIRGVHAYAGAGLFLLADRDGLRIAPPGYDGLERVPVDLTFDLGIQADTTLGVFKVGFSSLIGFLPDLGQNP